jgi:hypothetical protein
MICPIDRSRADFILIIRQSDPLNEAHRSKRLVLAGGHVETL